MKVQSRKLGGKNVVKQHATPGIVYATPNFDGTSSICFEMDGRVFTLQVDAETALRLAKELQK